MIGGRDRVRLVCFALCLAGFSLSWAVWAPGFMSPDSYHQLTQVESGRYADDHPTVMVLVWRAVNVFHDGPIGLFFLHLSVFWLSLLVVSLRLVPRLGVLASAPLLIGYSPPVFGSLGAIWKDIGLGISLLGALAVLTGLLHRFSWLRFSACALLLVYAQNVRHNAPAAVVPFWILLAVLALRHLQRSTSLRHVAIWSLALLALGSLSYKAVEALFLKPERTYFVQNLLLHDLAALSVANEELLIPEAYRDPDCTLQSLSEQLRDTRCYDPLFYGKDPIRRIPTKEATSSLSRLWLEEVAGNPAAYLAHRWKFFGGTLGWNRGPCRAPQILHLYDPRAPDRRWIDVVGLAKRAFDWFERFWLLFSPWAYLSLSAVLFLLGLQLERGPARSLTLVSSASGILYFLPYFFVSVCCDFRYSWWTVLSSLLAAVFWLSGRIGARSRAR